MRYAKGTMTETTDYEFAHLAPAEAGLGRMFARPKAIAAGCVIVIAGLGWLYLALVTAAAGNSWLAAMQALCRALPEDSWNASTIAVTALMWGAMMLAMMVPSAAPMILTYAEIAETAARKGEKIVTPLVIAAGYAGVWLGFSLIAATMQIAFARVLSLDTARELLTAVIDRKSTRLNSSHLGISYAVFCLKKKKHKTK